MIFQHDAKNLLLSALNAEDYAAVTYRGEVVDLVLDRSLAVAGDPIRYCWFPLAGLASIIAEDSDGRQAEVSMIGYEGVINGDVVSRSRQNSMGILVQVAGQALQVDFRNVAGGSAALQSLVTAFNQTLAFQTALSALAYSQYTIPQRLARWLMMCGDRVGDDNISLTHEKLSIMLGVRRAGVTVALHDMVAKGAITLQRGRQAIRNRALLLRIAGAGYGDAEAKYQRLVTATFPVTLGQQADEQRPEPAKH